MRKNRLYSEEEKLKLFNEVSKKIKNGEPKLKASRSVGIWPNTYEIWRRKFDSESPPLKKYKRKSLTPEIITLPAINSNPDKELRLKIVYELLKFINEK